MTKKYGLLYQGSKGRIVGWIIDHVPASPVFVDLFAGGCAVTHRAMESGLFDRVVANDLSDVPQLFKDAVDGKYRDETRWISRDDFERLKDSDLYVKYCWSFGNSGKSYLYSRELEEWKKAMHMAFVFRDYTLMDEYDPRLKGLIDAETCHQRRLNMKKGEYVMLNIIPNACRLEDLDYQYSPRQKDRNTVAPKKDILEFLSKRYSTTSLQSLQRLERLESLQSLQSLQSLERLQRLERIKSIDRLTISRLDYREVDLPQEATVYADPPYRGTTGYGLGFDFDEFDYWLAECGHLVIVSEYTPPKGCVKVAGVPVRKLFSQFGAGDNIEEGLYVHEKHYNTYCDLMNGQKPKLF